MWWRILSRPFLKLGRTKLQDAYLKIIICMFLVGTFRQRILSTHQSATEELNYNCQLSVILCQVLSIFSGSGAELSVEKGLGTNSNWNFNHHKHLNKILLSPSAFQWRKTQASQRVFELQSCMWLLAALSPKSPYLVGGTRSRPECSGPSVA